VVGVLIGAIIGWELLLLAPFIVAALVVVVVVRRSSSRPATTGSPPGWRSDPTGRHQLRYWDGTHWSDHVADRGEQSTDPIVRRTS
jgi:hypothetical protein